MDIDIAPLPAGWLLSQTRLTDQDPSDLRAAALILAAETNTLHAGPVDPAEQATRWQVDIDLEGHYERLHAATVFIFGIPGRWYGGCPPLLHGHDDGSTPDLRRRVAEAANIPYDPKPPAGTPADWERIGDRARHIVTGWQPGGDPSDLAGWTDAVRASSP